MELTAEQKYLKALAEWLDIENIPKNRIQEASRKYLDQLREVKEKVDQFTEGSKKVEPEPAWKPEVGKLYRRKLNGVITEVIKAFLDNREFSKVAHKLNRETIPLRFTIHKTIFVMPRNWSVVT